MRRPLGDRAAAGRRCRGRRFEASERRTGPRLRPPETLRGRQGRSTRPIRAIFRRHGARGIPRFRDQAIAGATRACSGGLRLRGRRTGIHRGRLRGPVGAGTRPSAPAHNSEDHGQCGREPHFDGPGTRRARLYGFDSLLIGEPRHRAGVSTRARWRGRSRRHGRRRTPAAPSARTAAA